jgi:hypothetical protein
MDLVQADLIQETNQVNENGFPDTQLNLMQEINHKHGVLVKFERSKFPKKKVFCRIAHVKLLKTKL